MKSKTAKILEVLRASQHTEQMDSTQRMYPYCYFCSVYYVHIDIPVHLHYLDKTTRESVGYLCDDTDTPIVYVHMKAF